MRSVRPFAFLSTLALALCVASFAHAQPRNQVHEDEVRRWGNSEQHVDGHIEAGATAMAEAMGPPASDADKWFVSVIGAKGCQACAALKQAWRSDPWLLAYARPDDPKGSWAHFNEYLREDQSQAFRWGEIQVTAFPTVIVQPPRSGKFGDSRTVVFQDVYRGDPAQLADSMREAIQRYVRVLYDGGLQQRQPFDVQGPCPWDPPPKTPPTPSPAPYGPYGPNVPVQIPPPHSVMPSLVSFAGVVRGLVYLVLALFVVGLLAGLVAAGWFAARRLSSPATTTRRRKA